MVVGNLVRSLQSPIVGDDECANSQEFPNQSWFYGRVVGGALLSRTDQTARTDLPTNRPCRHKQTNLDMVVQCWHKTGQGGWLSAVWVGRCGLRSAGLPGAASLGIPATIQAIPTPLFSLTIKLAPLQASFRDSILNFIALLLLSQSRFL